CHDMGDVAIWERIIEVAKTRSELADEFEALTNARDVYDECRKNRNSLTHFKLSTTDDGERVLARMKGPSMQIYLLPSDISDLRRVAVEILQLANHLEMIWQALANRTDGHYVPLPEKLPVPELLWKPPPQAPKASKPPRRSSRKK